MIDLWSPVYLGFCLMYLGQFHHAIGCLDCYWRLALDRPNQDMALNFQAVMGIVLVLSRKNREALFHLNHAADQALQSQNGLALIFRPSGSVLPTFF